MPPAIRNSHAQHKRASQRFLVDLLQSVAQVALLFFIFTALVGRFEIRQSSMEPTFYEGQRVMVNQMGSVLPVLSGHTAYAATGSDNTPSVLRRGQVVVFYKTPQHNEDPLIKRLIGLPGDTVEIRDNEVWLNGTLLDEPYIHNAYTDCTNYCGPLTLEAEEYFFIGDNRPVSGDSRQFGPIPADQIVGPVVVRYWPPTAFTLDP
jgi:signal peptidase I